MNWFEVDKEGLAKLLHRRGMAFVLQELVSNAWDERASEVDITLERIAASRLVRLVVTDNNPEGFADLRHAFVLYAESAKKADAGRRGRYNLGEKLVLALAERAEIASTTGTIVFDAQGRHRLRKRLSTGSRITVDLRMTEEQRRECDAAAKLLLPPAGVATRYNGQLLAPRQPLASTEATLATEVADAEGFLRRSQRRTRVEIHEPAAGETPTLYELGIPVVESGLPWHVNVGQKVPLSFERDNVPPAYQSKLRALVLEEMHAKLQTEDANQAWVRDAIQHHGADLSGSAIGAVVQARFGDKRVSYDPSDPEANSRAVAAGYTVVHGGQMSAAEWEAVRRTGAIRPAGQVTPSPKPFDPEGKPLKFVAQQDWSEAMRAVAQLARELAGRVLKVPVTVKIANEVGWPFAATYGDGTLILNLGRLGHRWFNGPLAPVVDLLVHEFGHHYEMNHLAKEYHDALTRLAGEVTAVALSEPALFARWMREEATA